MNSTMQTSRFTQPVAEHVWKAKYQWADSLGMREPSLDATLDRVALAISSAEVHHHNEWRERFRALLHDFRFLPGGRILANAGTHRGATLFNCFVMGTIEDSISGIFGALREAMVTMQYGGGVGVDFSTLRPAGTAAISTGGVASGPVSFMHLWELASATLESTSNRRGAMMATLRCDHPDIEAFIDAKRTPGVLTHFNLSVLVSDEFLHAIEEDAPWPLVFPAHGHRPPEGAQMCMRLWSGAAEPELCVVVGQVSAKGLWGKIVDAIYKSAEPGLLFVDRINSANNLWYCEKLSATNPCGEIPLPPYGACNLGSINLTRFVVHPFSAHPKFNFAELIETAALATRFLDDVYEVTQFPLKAQDKAARASRRLGLGVTGLADTFLMLGLRYGSASSLEVTEKIMQTVRDTAYRASVGLARKKGAFPLFDTHRYCAAPFILNLPKDIQDAIAAHGIRNSHLLAVAPAGSISLLASNVSSGIEPVFAFDAKRDVHLKDGSIKTFDVEDYATGLFRARFGPKTPLADYFVSAEEVSAKDQLAVQSVVQTFVDSAVSKTLNLPVATSPKELGDALLHAYQIGLKGCTVYRAGGLREAVVTSAAPHSEMGHCST
jgi:ribonucleoside-diphosphate reductase alpha chain